jgi:hypothetical protein
MTLLTVDFPQKICTFLSTFARCDISEDLAVLKGSIAGILRLFCNTSMVARVARLLFLACYCVGFGVSPLLKGW